MSRFAAAVNMVINELERHRDSGRGDWRATNDAMQGLRNAQPAQPVQGQKLAQDQEPAQDEQPARPVQDQRPAQTEQPVRGEPGQSKNDRLAALRACPDRLPCEKCPYGRQEHQHIVFGVGNADAELMFIGEAPGAEEDAQGEPFVGRAGQLLTRIINTMGYERESIYIANVLKCRPDTPGQSSGNRPPTVAEMHSCRPTLYEQIEIIAPKVIVALGATAMRGLLDSDEPMGKLRGRWHDFGGVPVMATYHPSYLLRNQSPAEKRKVWEDMLLVKERLGHEITDRDRGYFLTKA